MAQVKERGGAGEEREETFLRFLKPSFPFPSPSFIFWFSFHFSRGQNRKSLSTVFFYSVTKRKRSLRRLVRNPESWVLESRIQLKESRIPLTIGIQSPISTDKDWNPVHGIRNPLRGAQNPRLSWIPSTRGDLSILTFHLPLHYSKSVAGILCTLSLAVVPRWFFWFPDKFSRRPNCYYCCRCVKMWLSDCGDARRWYGLNWALREKEIKLNVELNYPQNMKVISPRASKNINTVKYIWNNSFLKIKNELFHIYFTSFHSSREIWTQ